MPNRISALLGDLPMTKLEHYRTKAAESLAATEAATNARDRAFHHRAYSVWRRLIAGAAEAEERAALAAERTAAAKPRVAGK
jgi:hypothetical protein